MKQIFLSKNGIIVEEVPDPLVSKNFVLVSNNFSCVSIGTELSSLLSINKPLLKKVIEKPDIFKKFLNVFSEVGYKKIRNIVQKKLNQLYEIGYSSSGEVLEVGDNIDNFKKGDLVACSGGGIASHAEKILVPKNLLVKINKKENLFDCSTVSIGAIAINGIRRSNPTIGESFVVIGLGLIGQITIQILKNCGIDVYAVEPNLDYLKKAKENGFQNVYENFEILNKSLSSEIKNVGLDGAIITASSKSNLILKETFRLCRKKARVILVGDVGLAIDREDIYRKEIDFKISSSYGPGRYDADYELAGIDYPIGFVRWTMNRNMRTYVKMIENKQINLKNLIEYSQPIEKAKDLYDLLKKKNRPLSVLFTYKKTEKNKIQTSIRKNSKKSKKIINCAVIGAGSFANEIIIPNILKYKSFCSLDSVCTKTSLSAINLSKNLKIKNISTNYLDILNNKEIDTVFITTRHDLHFKIIKESINKNKNIFVEKPICLKKQELNEIKKLLEKKKSLIFFSGFNRRFSNYAKIMKDFINNQEGPILISYDVNAEILDNNSWIYNKEGGGRNIGEACHFYDLFLFLIDKKVENLNAASLNFEKKKFHKTDNFHVLIEFEDSSIAKLNYLAMGGGEKKKEFIRICGQNETLEVIDFKSALLKTKHSHKKLLSTRYPEKGHEILIKKFLDNIINREENISIDDQIQSMMLTFKIEELL